MSELVAKLSVKTKGKVILALLATVIVTAIVYQKFTPYMAWASVAYFIMTLGVVLRKHKNYHIPLMVLAIVLDLVLVLILEFNRGAIATAAGFELTLPQQLHIGFSTLATVCYFPMLYMGFKLNKAKAPMRNLKRKHLVTGVVTYIFRTLGFLLMFSLITHVK